MTTISAATLTHFDANGHAHMVNVGAKPDTQRLAVAQGFIVVKSSTLDIIMAGKATKGDVLGIARVAGIMAAKRTSDLIPLCHPLTLTHVALVFVAEQAESRIACMATVKTNGPTGVEMEALTAVQIALLTIYDMCKAIDRTMTITNICLLEKQGGKSGSFKRDNETGM